MGIKTIENGHYSWDNCVRHWEAFVVASTTSEGHGWLVHDNDGYMVGKIHYGDDCKWYAKHFIFGQWLDDVFENPYMAIVYARGGCAAMEAFRSVDFVFNKVLEMFDVDAHFMGVTAKKGKCYASGCDNDALKYPNNTNMFCTEHEDVWLGEECAEEVFTYKRLAST